MRWAVTNAGVAVESAGPATDVTGALTALSIVSFSW